MEVKFKYLTFFYSHMIHVLANKEIYGYGQRPQGSIHIFYRSGNFIVDVACVSINNIPIVMTNLLPRKLEDFHRELLQRGYNEVIQTTELDQYKLYISGLCQACGYGFEEVRIEIEKDMKLYPPSSGSN
jgi:hypothetical protein